jgi:hypothetical protein
MLVMLGCYTQTKNIKQKISRKATPCDYFMVVARDSRDFDDSRPGLPKKIAMILVKLAQSAVVKDSDVFLLRRPYAR